MLLTHITHHISISRHFEFPDYSDDQHHWNAFCYVGHECLKMSENVVCTSIIDYFLVPPGKLFSGNYGRALEIVTPETLESSVWSPLPISENCIKNV